MKKTFLIFYLAVLSVGLEAQTRIAGEFQFMQAYSNEIYLLAITNYEDVFASTHKYNIDTAIVDTDGRFEFIIEGLPCTECLYRIDIRPKDSAGAIIFIGTSKENFVLFELIDNQSLEIKGDARQLTKSFTINGQMNNWTYESIRKLREPVYEISDQLLEQLTDTAFLKGKNLDSLREAGTKRLIESLTINNKKLLELMNSSSNIYDKIIGSKLYDFDMKMDNDLAIYEAMSNQIEEKDPDHPFYIQLSQDIYETKYTLPKGSKAPYLKLSSVEGKEISLSDIGENLILIDFWASWCSPCRHENSVTVKPLYEKYKDEGFMVYSVSLDIDKEKWTKAIEKDGMSWINVSDLMGNDSPVYSIYKIKELPTTYLIEKDGLKIIAKNIRGEELERFVEEYYK